MTGQGHPVNFGILIFSSWTHKMATQWAFLHFGSSLPTEGNLKLQAAVKTFGLQTCIANKCFVTIVRSVHCRPRIRSAVLQAKTWIKRQAFKFWTIKGTIFTIELDQPKIEQISGHNYYPWKVYAGGTVLHYKSQCLWRAWTSQIMSNEPIHIFVDGVGKTFWVKQELTQLATGQNLINLE